MSRRLFKVYFVTEEELRLRVRWEWCVASGAAGFCIGVVLFLWANSR